jgi:hypothetical protein
MNLLDSLSSTLVGIWLEPQYSCTTVNHAVWITCWSVIPGGKRYLERLRAGSETRWSGLIFPLPLPVAGGSTGRNVAT